MLCVSTMSESETRVAKAAQEIEKGSIVNLDSKGRAVRPGEFFHGVKGGRWKALSNVKAGEVGSFVRMPDSSDGT